MTKMSSYFSGFAAKLLSAVDATKASNQHEIGSNKFTAILGNPGAEKIRYKARYIKFEDVGEPESLIDEVTYYDTRLNKTGRSPEYRLYYKSNSVTKNLRAGDLCIVAKAIDGTLFIIFAGVGSMHQRRLCHLFDLKLNNAALEIDNSVSKKTLDLTRVYLLEALGIQAVEPADDLAERAVEKFKGQFPSTKDFSDFARLSLENELTVHDDPDFALESWMEQEERIFRAFEKRILESKIKSGFAGIDEFISFSLSVQNRRKSRVGHAFENHIEAALKALGVKYVRGARTERNSRPDFLFPSVKSYRDLSVGSPPLRMLAAKTTCKDRWRQVLSEADRIPTKHLITLEPAISENQTSEMKVQGLQLVATSSVRATYTECQKNWILTFGDFVKLVTSS
ncbi:MAG TPA: type II restriction endonuclease [Hydrogenophaga sp.]|uniref:type II restriction endonuclease n=1 Tax=Hydrogenophaga sp. TaxID=1904254 RepID=UPI002CE7DDE9|nr:type II restriction endonuclease [Hydrogenophaga sp.]HMN92804.1 type II restriction endonuclease [Hydrogenophaga sp.]HMP10355.1 type II restriction endonuclease [Hydrogenophaga sp.]